MKNGLLIVLTMAIAGCASVDHGSSTSTWNIGLADDSPREFDMRPHDDAQTVVFDLGSSTAEFPGGLGTDVGEQRSAIEIRWTAAIPKGSAFLIRWSPGGSESKEQFRVAIDGVSWGESPVLAGAVPERWREDVFSLPRRKKGQHVITLTHLMGDGLNIDYVAVVME